MEETKFIEDSFRIRQCFKYHQSENSNLCKCGKSRSFHRELNDDTLWSIENNTKTKVCDTYGSIKFEGCDDFSANFKSKEFIKFDCIGDPLIAEKAYELIEKIWKFPKPGLIISINGGYKRMNSTTLIQKNRFQQGLIDLMKKEKTWLIGGASNFGIHGLVSEAVHDYRLYHDGNEDQIKLIGICTWGVVRQNEYLLQRNATYPKSDFIEKRQITLDANCDCFLLCDDGTEKQYDKEIKFRLQFEKYIHETKNAFAMQILFEGGLRALEMAYFSLKQSVPLIVINESGRTADIICEIKNYDDRNFKENISELLVKNKNKLGKSVVLPKYKQYLEEIYLKYREKIFIYDMTDQSINLDKKILEAIISSKDDINLDNLLRLTIQFNSYDLAEKKVFQNSEFNSLTQEVLGKHFCGALKNNRHQFIRLFLEYNLNVEKYLTKNVLVDLYKNSLTSSKCRCTDLLKDLIYDVGKIHILEKNNDKFLIIIKKIIRQLTGNILKMKKLDCKISNKNTETSYAQVNRSDVEVELRPTNIEEAQDIEYLSIKDLFLWALLSGYTDTAMFLWKSGKSHISSALIGSIILNKMGNCALRRGDSEISKRLLLGSKKFLEFTYTAVDEAFENNQMKTYMILFREIEIWDNLSCLQIAICGGLTEFLNLSVCKAYTKEAWVGDFSSFTPTWKMLLTIPFSVVFIRPLIMPYYSEKKPIRELKNISKVKQAEEQSKELPVLEKKTKHISYIKALNKFYKVPQVKFIIYLVSYISFLLAFAYLNLVEMQPINKYKSLWNIKPVEIFVYVYILTSVLEEIRQVIDQKQTKFFHKLIVYISGSWNAFDIFLILLFSLSTILRFILPEEQFVIIQCSFSITLSLYCLRTMQFYCISQYIGPKVIIIRKMMVDIGFFLSIFVLFLVSYGLLVQSVLYEHTEFSLSLIKDVFYSPYFQTYGELMLESFNVPSCNNTACVVKYSTVMFGFAVFLLLSNILLINLLIAMFGRTYSKVQDESEKYVAFIQIQLVEEFYQKPLLPPPLNIFNHIVIRCCILLHLFRSGKNKKSDSFLAKQLQKENNIKIDRYEKIIIDSSFLKLEMEKNAKCDVNSDIKYGKEKGKLNLDLTLETNNLRLENIEKLLTKKLTNLKNNNEEI